MPALVAVGEFDLPGIHNQCREMAEALPTATFIEIPASAHCPQLDQADRVAGLVLEFLESVK